MLCQNHRPNRDDIELVAVNATGSEDIIEYGLKYDSVPGRREDIAVQEMDICLLG